MLILTPGMVLGGVGTFPATSALCQWTWFDGGWPSVFYVFGKENFDGGQSSRVQYIRNVVLSIPV